MVTKFLEFWRWLALLSAVSICRPNKNSKTKFIDCTLLPEVRIQCVGSTHPHKKKSNAHKALQERDDGIVSTQWVVPDVAID